METKMLERVAALLAKAESTDSPHEAEALVAKAQTLASAYAIDLAVARRHTAGRQRREEPEQRRLQVGEHGKQGNRHFVNLFLQIAHANDVRCDIASSNVSVFAYGFPSDLDVAQTLFGSLATQMVASANGAIARGEHRHERYWSHRARAYRTDARVFRTSFYQAFTATIGERLQQARRAAEQQAASGQEAQQRGGAEGVALALREKAAEVSDYYHRNSSARGTWDGNRARSTHLSLAGHAAGRRAGETARLRPSTPLPGERQRLPGH